MKGISDCTNLLIFCAAQGRLSQWRFKNGACARTCMYMLAGLQVGVRVCQRPIRTHTVQAHTVCTRCEGDIPMLLAAARKGISFRDGRLQTVLDPTGGLPTGGLPTEPPSPCLGCRPGELPHRQAGQTKMSVRVTVMGACHGHYRWPSEAGSVLP